MLGFLVLAAAIVAVDPGEMVGPPNLSIPRSSNPEKLAAYEARRNGMPDTADAHWKLGVWCEQNGLKGEATVEFLAVTRLDPRRDAAWKKLGYEKKNGRWTTAEQLAAERAELDAQRKADAKWRPALQKWKGMLSQKPKRVEAETALAGVTDPRAIPSIWRVFANGNAADQERAILMLGHIEGIGASQALACLAVYGKTEAVRRAAVETLTRRDTDEVFMTWIGMLREPMKYEIRRGADPGSRGFLVVDGAQHKFRMSYEPPSAQVSGAADTNFSPFFNRIVLPLQFDSHPPGPPPGSRVVGSLGNITLFVHTWKWDPPIPPPKPAAEPTAAYKTYEQTMLQARINRDYEIDQTIKNNEAAEVQLQEDIHMIEVANGDIRERNHRLVTAMRRISGKDFGTDREAWLKWWIERKGYRYIPPPNDKPKETVEVKVPVGEVSVGPPLLVPGGSGGGGSTSGWCMLFDQQKGKLPVTGTCFASGTPVLTPEGPRAIESLRAGDQILTTDATRGVIRSAEVTSVHHGLSSRILRLTTAGETIVTTPGHPFRKIGSGWTKAGDLIVGDLLLTRVGLTRVDAIKHSDGGEVWNLDVKDGSNYLVGQAGILVHDFGPIAGQDSSGY